MRLNKFIASCGICSRRKADDLIQLGKIKVNGVLINTPGVNIDEESDIVEYDGKKINLERIKIVYLFSKPYGVTSTNFDLHAEKTVSDYFDFCEYRLFPVGRLDKESTGLILMTNDGKLAQQLSHPSGEKYKTYLVLSKGILTHQEINLLRHGILLEEDLTIPAKIDKVKIEKGNTKFEISIREGKNRQIRRMLDKINHPVLELRRVAIGKLRDENLKDGEFRKLSLREINELLMEKKDESKRHSSMDYEENYKRK